MLISRTFNVVFPVFANSALALSYSLVEFLTDKEFCSPAENRPENINFKRSAAFDALSILLPCCIRAINNELETTPLENIPSSPTARLGIEPPDERITLIFDKDCPRDMCWDIASSALP